MDVEVRASAEWKALARRLADTDRVVLAKELRKGLNRAAKPAQAAVRAALPTYMPSGYAPVLAAALRLRTSARPSGVRISATAAGRKNKRALGAMQEGLLRHPVFGRYSQPWVDQRIRAGFFTEPILDRTDDIRAEMVRVLQGIAEKIAKG